MHFRTKRDHFAVLLPSRLVRPFEMIARWKAMKGQSHRPEPFIGEAIRSLDDRTVQEWIEGRDGPLSVKER